MAVPPFREKRKREFPRPEGESSSSRMGTEEGEKDDGIRSEREEDERAIS